jgi:ABC-type amino acid transport substrate-binding protein
VGDFSAAASPPQKNLPYLNPHIQKEEEIMKRLSPVLLVLMAVLLVTACKPPATPPADKLAEVLARGTIIVSTDPAYPPQSELVEGAQRLANTKCTSDQRTANELQWL